MTLKNTLLGSLVLASLFITACNDDSSDDKTTTPSTQQDPQTNNPAGDEATDPEHANHGETGTQPAPETNPPHLNPNVDAQILLGNESSTDYVIKEISNPAIAAKDSHDPELVFTIGKRYEIKVENFAAHPFAIIDATGNIVLGGTDGTHNQDTGVNLIDHGEGRIEFTYTDGLAAAATAYICTNHRSSMTGTIKTADATIPTDDTIADIVDEALATNIQVAFNNNGFTDYTIATAPADVAPLLVNDPTLNLKKGQSYQFTISTGASHPMALVDAAGNTVIEMDSNNLIIFTLTDDLASKITGYVCKNHPDMSGSIVIN
jgi:plastocyanin